MEFHSKGKKNREYFLQCHVYIYIYIYIYIYLYIYINETFAKAIRSGEATNYAEVSRYERPAGMPQGEQNTNIRECCIISAVILALSVMYLAAVL